MALFPREKTPAPVAETEPDYDVMALRNLHDHPTLRPLVTRKVEVQRALHAKARECQRLTEALRALEHRETEQIAALGAAWDPAEYRQLKQALDEAEREERLLGAGVVAIDEQSDALHAEVREDIEKRMNDLRLPLVEQAVAALASMIESNRALHGIEALSQRLLGVARWHLVDPSLEPRLALMRRTLPLLAPAPPAADHVA
jgi:predicted  nucleic acid-binding Zn-ribbon protein